MKLSNLLRVTIELLLSFIIQRVVQVNIPITGNKDIDSIIYGVVSYGLVLLSLINLIQVFIAHRKGKEKRKLTLLVRMGLYLAIIVGAVAVWHLIQFWLFWVVFGAILITYIVYYIKNREYKKEVRLYKKSIKKALSVEFDFKITKLKIHSQSENFITLNTSDGKFYVVVIPNEEITTSDTQLQMLDAQYSIVPTAADDQFIQLRYLTLFVVKNLDDLIPLYTYLTM